MKKPLGLVNRAFCIVCKIRRDFEADESVNAVRFFVDRAQNIAGILDVFDDKGFVDFSDPLLLFNQVSNLFIVFAAVGDRLTEDRGVGSDATLALVLHAFSQLAVGDHATSQIVYPKALTLLNQPTQIVHWYLLPNRQQNG